MFQTIARHVDETLENENWFTLNKMVLAQLVGLCQERDLPTEGDKKLLIQVLLEYKNNVKPIPAPSTPQLMNAEPSTTAQLHTLSALNFQSIFQVGPDINGTGTGEIPYDKLEIGKKLGSGGFKDCYAGVYLGEPVAIGELRLTQFTDLDLQEIRNEIGVLKQLRHENIVRFIGVCSNPKHLSIITELCENGDMYDYVRKVRKPNFAQQVMFMHDISLGVSYLHTRRPSIIHRDMKSMNVLISGNLRAKINDFGLARIRPRANATLHTQCGTPNWQAPEFWCINPSYTEKVYACGLIFWEILSWGESGYPYQDMNEHVLYEQVRDHSARPPLTKLKPRYPQSLLVLIQEMWQKEPKKRPSMNQVVERLAQYLE